MNSMWDRKFYNITYVLTFIIRFEYDEALKKHWHDATKEFWDVFMNADNVPGPTKSARQLIKNIPPDKLWFEFTKLTRNLSCYGDFRY